MVAIESIYGLLESIIMFSGERRQGMVAVWVGQYLVNARGILRLAGLYETLLADLLYEPTKLVLRNTSLGLLGSGKDELAFKLSWLTKRERNFLYQCHRDRARVFDVVNLYENSQFECFKHNVAVELVWRRLLAREFVLFVYRLSGQPEMAWLRLEMTVALQKTLLQHTKDIFVASLHAGLQQRANLDEIPCWGLQKWDIPYYGARLMPAPIEESAAAAVGAEKKK